jgi:hypothetical protein
MAYSERLLTHGNFLTRIALGGRYRRALELAGDVRGGSLSISGAATP